MTTLAEAQGRDAVDPVRAVRERFRLPGEVIYLDGNSLGAMPRAAVPLVADAVERQWGERLVRSWADWFDAPQRIGDKIGSLIGARPGETIVTDSTSANLFKLIVAAGRLAGGRATILCESANFPTDLHVANGAAALLGMRVRAVPRDEIEAAIDDDTALLVLTHVHYKSGARFDMARLTEAARARGARAIWDFSHSTGAVPLDLGADGVELAVGCGYKYLNGGPGAPAFLYVAEHLQDQLVSPIQGWIGHAAPFDFSDEYAAAPGVARFQCGTPNVLSLLALEAGVDEWLAVDRDAVWEKGRALFDLFAALMAQRCPDFALVTPTDAERRGSHISFRHANAWPICGALIARGVIGDFRAPDILRFGLSPLYTRFADVWHAVDALAEVMASGEWRDSRFAEKARVT